MLLASLGRIVFGTGQNLLRQILTLFGIPARRGGLVVFVLLCDCFNVCFDFYRSLRERVLGFIGQDVGFVRPLSCSAITLVLVLVFIVLLENGI